MIFWSCLQATGFVAILALRFVFLGKRNSRRYWKAVMIGLRRRGEEAQRRLDEAKRQLDDAKLHLAIAEIERDKVCK
jgi:hypothetical protein